MQNYIVVNPGGLFVRSQMDTTNPANRLRSMSNGEGFIVYDTYTQKGTTGLETWARISNNGGGLLQEYTCLSIGNRVYALPQAMPAQPAPATPIDVIRDIVAWAITKG